MSETLSFREKLGYGVGDMASNFYLSFFGLLLLYYYTDIYGLAPAAVGTMFLVTKVIDAISDPLMGLVADRTRSRWGMYRPYLLWGAIPYALCGYALVAGPDLSDGGKLLYAYITYSLVMLAYTAINVPYSALLGVISPSAIERTRATTFRFFCAAAGGLAIGSLATPLKNILGGGDEALGIQLTMLLFAAASVVLFWITFATTRERIRPAQENADIGSDLRSLLHNRSWIVLVITGILLMTGLVVRTSTVLYYFKYIVMDSGETVFLIFDRTAIFLTLGTISQMLGVLLTQWLAARFDKARLVQAMSLLHVALLLLFFVVPTSEFGLMTLVHSLGLMTFGPTITLLFAMYTDCAEFGEWKTGRRTTALIVSASMFSLKFGVAVGAALPGFVLSVFGFVANAIQTDQASLGIRLMFSILPAAFFLLGGLMMHWYRIDRKMLAQIESELSVRRQAQSAPG